jgi:hypothetical protein
LIDCEQDRDAGRCWLGCCGRLRTLALERLSPITGGATPRLRSCKSLTRLNYLEALRDVVE